MRDRPDRRDRRDHRDRSRDSRLDRDSDLRDGEYYEGGYGDHVSLPWSFIVSRL